MKRKILDNTFRFLERVDLKGAEVPAFNECINELTKLHKEEIEQD